MVEEGFMVEAGDDARNMAMVKVAVMVAQLSALSLNGDIGGSYGAVCLEQGLQLQRMIPANLYIPMMQHL